jgi:Obg family GTPase CgtA-like protein
MSDPSYPGQWRITGDYVEQVAKMTHWEYPQAVARFGRQLGALGIAEELQRRGATAGDLVMVDSYDFEFSPQMTNPYLPQELIEKEIAYERGDTGEEEEESGAPVKWRPFQKGGFMDVDTDELVGFDDEDWGLLDEDFDEDGNFAFDEDEVWTA